MNKSVLLKSLALLLSFLLAFSSAGLSAMADGEIKPDAEGYYRAEQQGTYTITGDANGHVYVRSEDGQTVTLTVTGNIKETSKDHDEALSVGAENESTIVVTVECDF